MDKFVFCDLKNISKKSLDGYEVTLMTNNKMIVMDGILRGKSHVSYEVITIEAAERLAHDLLDLVWTAQAEEFNRDNTCETVFKKHGFFIEDRIDWTKKGFGYHEVNKKTGRATTVGVVEGNFYLRDSSAYDIEMILNAI